jgi:hypothetical protein
MIPEGFNFKQYEKYPHFEGLTVEAIFLPWGYVDLFQGDDGVVPKVRVQRYDVRDLGQFLIACADAMEAE